MKKTFLVILFFAAGIAAVNAQRFMSRTGKIYFSAIIPGTPEVEAVNNEVATILDAKTGEIVCAAPIKSFKFKRELMQQHFNENYMQSDKFPRAEFKGSITNLSQVNFAKDGNYPAAAKGNLTIHGVTHEVTVPGSIAVKGNTMTVKAKFSVAVGDYNISIPSLVSDKVAKIATIDMESVLSLK